MRPTLLAAMILTVTLIAPAASSTFRSRAEALSQDTLLAASSVYLPMIQAAGQPVPPTATPTRTPIPPTATPTRTPLPTATPCNTSVQLVQNESFETGISPWIPSGLAYRTSVRALTGYYSVQLGSYNNAQDGLGQYLTMPTWAEAGLVQFGYYMSSTDSIYTRWDDLVVGVWDGDTLVAAGAVWNTDIRNQWVHATLPLPDVTALRGHTLLLLFGGFTDSTFPTTWWIDHVWLNAFCGSGGAAAVESAGSVVLSPADPAALEPLRKLRSTLQSSQTPDAQAR